MLDITIFNKQTGATKTFKCPSFECIYKKECFIAIPFNVIVPFIKQLVYLDEFEIIIENIHYSNAEYFYCPNPNNMPIEFKKLTILYYYKKFQEMFIFYYINK